MQDKKKRLQMEGVLSSFISTPGFQQETTAENPSQTNGLLSSLSVRIPSELLEQVRDLAYWERQSFQTFVQQAFEHYVASFDAETLEKAKNARIKR